MFRQLFEAFPDMKMEVVSVVAEGDRVGVNATVTATHLGAFAGVPRARDAGSWAVGSRSRVRAR